MACTFNPKLMHQILDLLKNGGTPQEPSRIINVSSLGHLAGQLNAEVLDCNALNMKYDPAYQYCSSKIAIMHWTNRLARKLKKVNVISLTVNPGTVAEILRAKTLIFVHNFAVSYFLLLSDNYISGKFE